LRSLEELIKSDSSAIDQIRRCVEQAESPCEILPPSADCDRTLLAVQKSTDSLLGAIAYETGGVLVDHGWLRFLGCGHAKLPRNLDDWNHNRAAGLCLVADDVVGGFFAVNCGAYGDDEDMYYWAPDSLEWEPIGFEFEFFFRWSLTSVLGDFYQHFRWSSWASDIAHVLPNDHCFIFDPPLWSGGKSDATAGRRTLSVAEAYARKLAAQQSGA
jgi:hypothetical protein